MTAPAMVPIAVMTATVWSKVKPEDMRYFLKSSIPIIDQMTTPKAIDPLNSQFGVGGIFNRQRPIGP